MFKCRTIFVTLTYKCNVFCEKCATRRSPDCNKSMPQEILNRVIEQIKINNYQNNIALGTGETLLYENLSYFIENILDINEKITIRILTNGKAFKLPLPIIYFDPRVQWIVTMDGFYQSDLDNLQYSQDIEAVKENLKELVKNGYGNNLLFNYTLNAENVKHLLEYVKFAQELNIKKIYVTQLKVFREFEEKLHQYDINVEDSMFKKLIKEVQQFSDKNDLNVFLPDFNRPLKERCWEKGILSPTINYNGNISFCSGREDAVIANISDPDYLNKWQNMLNFLSKSKNSSFWCKQCYNNNSTAKFYSHIKNKV